MTLAADKLPPGRWYARVSALDEDHFEGPFLTTAPIDVAQVQLSTGAPGSVRVTLVTSGIHLMCGVDEGLRTLRPARLMSSPSRSEPSAARPRTSPATSPSSAFLPSS